MAIKKTIKFVLVFAFIASQAFAGGVILKGETFRAKEDIRFFTLEESRKLLQDLNELDILRKQVAIYKDNERLFLEKIAKYEEALRLQATAIDAYGKSIKALESEVVSLRSAVKESLDAIKLQKETIKIQARRERRNRWMQPIKNIAWGLGGAAIGNALGGVGLSVKFK